MDKDTERIAGAVAQLVSAIQELRSLGVIRSRKLAPDFAEWLVAELFGGQLAESRTQPGWDVTCERELIQVKAAFLPVDSANRWSYVSVKHPFHVLVLVVLSDEFRVKELYKVPSEELLPRLKTDREGQRINWNDLKPWRVTRSGIRIQEHLSLFLDLT